MHGSFTWGRALISSMAFFNDSSPLLAMRNNESVPILRHNPNGGTGGAQEAEKLQKPVPRLGQGPFEVFLGLETQAESTVVHVRITRRHASRPLYQAWSKVAGGDWANAAVVLHTPSPVTPFSVALDRVWICGRLAPGKRMEVIPWRS